VQERAPARQSGSKLPHSKSLQIGCCAKPLPVLKHCAPFPLFLTTSRFNHPPPVVGYKFTPVSEKGFRAVNRDGYFVDIVKAEPRPPWKDEPSNLGAADTLEAAPIKSLNWLLSAPKFSDIAIGWDGVPVPIVCPDPRSYSLQKLWLSSQPDRDPLKKGRDRAQAFAVASVVLKHMPQLPFLPGDLLNFPKEIVGSGDDGALARLIQSFGD
jgi:hypothetical protein